MKITFEETGKEANVEIKVSLEGEAGHSVEKVDRVKAIAKLVEFLFADSLMPKPKGK